MSPFSILSLLLGSLAVPQQTIGSRPATPGQEALGPAPSIGGVVPLGTVPLGCAVSVEDQAKPGACLEASSTPGPGLLFPPPHDGGVNNDSSGTNSFIGDGQDNVASGNHAAVGGGRLNSAGDYAVVGGGLSNAATSQATIGGGFDNFATNLSAIGGGQFNTSNFAFGAIAGGYANSTTGYLATIGGGYANFAGQQGTVGGGQYNVASFKGTVAGGWGNTADGVESAVGGGQGNYAAGLDSTIPGGLDNRAGGPYSFAAGRRAKATHQGSFVWGDSINVDKTSSTFDEFNVYAEGGLRVFAVGAVTPSMVVAPAGSVGIGTSAPAFLLEVNGSAGKPGGGAWSVSSDARLKKNVRPLEGALAKLLALRGVAFEYEDPAAIHELPGERVGFVAQEVEPVMPDWVEEGADGMKRLTIRGFEALSVEALRELQGENRALEARLAARDAELESMRERLERLEARETGRSAPDPAGR